MTENSVRSELAAAVRAVNAEFLRLPDNARNQLDLSTIDLDLELDRALLADDRGRALKAIQSWREHHITLIRRAAR